MDEPQIQTRLPENAYRELKPGETYEPMVPAGARVPEVSLRSVLFGIAMNIIFSMAATYLALKVGQGIETAIPISILAVGLSGLLLKMGHRRSTVIENINILAISTTSGIVAGGTVFTMPAIYLLKLDEKLGLGQFELFATMFFVPLLGAVLGVIFLVPFRRYFVREMHGKLPFPEATATNEILATGAGGGATGAAVLIYSFVVAGLYTILASGLKLWHERFTTGTIAYELKERVVSTVAETGQEVITYPSKNIHALAFAGEWGTMLTEKLKIIFSLGTSAEFLGLGYIIGVRYASIICAGSFLSWFFIVPFLAPLGIEALQNLNPTIDATTAEAIFGAIPKNIGIGCIFAAGLLSILKMSKVIVTALREALGSLFRKSAATDADLRTERDISYPALVGLGVLVTAAMAVYFYSFVMNGFSNALSLTIVSLLLALIVSFVFITVSAWAIATISVTPISGMTVTTIIITAVVLLQADLPRGPQGQLAVLLVGGVVATALSMAGTLVTEFKLGYWTGATPKRIQWSAIIACVLASAVVTLTIMILKTNPGYDTSVNAGALEAPQANLMRSALETFVGATADGESRIPWLMYGVGIVLALIMQLLNISPLAFGLGMYLPMHLNTPILVGAIVAALVQRGAKDPATAKARNDKGVLIASGLIAGAAIMGVIIRGVSAGAQGFMLKLDMPARWIDAGKDKEEVLRFGNWLGPIMFLALCLFVFFNARRAKPTGEFREVPTHGH
jgi:OPT family oligopeptide transporter